MAPVTNKDRWDDHGKRRICKEEAKKAETINALWKKKEIFALSKPYKQYSNPKWDNNTQGTILIESQYLNVLITQGVIYYKPVSLYDLM
jgi:hypothetical protein